MADMETDSGTKDKLRENAVQKILAEQQRADAEVAKQKQQELDQLLRECKALTAKPPRRRLP